MTENGSEFELSGFLPYRITAAAQRISASLASKYRSVHDLSAAEWRVLVHLRDAGEVSVGKLAQMASLEKSKVSRAAARLAAQGLIVKPENASDRRLIRMSLTDEGHALMAQLLPIAIAYQKRLEALLDEHLTSFEAALDTLNKEELE